MNSVAVFPHINMQKYSELRIMLTQQDQRTNGPVNAHLRPEMYINKLV